MKVNVYSIYDLKGMCYGPTFEYGQDEEAKRFATDLANDARGPVGRYPSDYILHRVGAFDNGTGRLVSIDQPVLVVGLADLVKKVVKE